MTDKLTKQLFLLLAAGLPLASHASPPETGPQPIPLYGENTPAESNGMSREGVTLTADILTGAADADYFLLRPDPDKTSGMAVVICRAADTVAHATVTKGSARPSGFANKVFWR